MHFINSVILKSPDFKACFEFVNFLAIDFHPHSPFHLLVDKIDFIDIFGCLYLEGLESLHLFGIKLLNKRDYFYWIIILCSYVPINYLFNISFASDQHCESIKFKQNCNKLSKPCIDSLIACILEPSEFWIIGNNEIMDNSDIDRDTFNCRRSILFRGVSDLLSLT